MGRPTRLTPRVIDAVCDAIEAGANYHDAAAAAGIAAETLDKWRAEAKAIFERVAASREPVALPPKEMRLFAFYKRFAQAEGQGAVSCATVVYNAAMKDPEWALRWLERRRPEDWSIRIRQELSGPRGGPIDYRDVSELTDDELAAIAARGRGGAPEPPAGAP